MIKVKAKKIGNAQRMYLEYFYRELFNEESDSYADLLFICNNSAISRIDGIDSPVQ